MASMLAELQKLVSPELLFDVTRQTHEPDVAVAKAYNAAIPALVATITNRSDDRNLMNGIVDFATSASADPDPVESARRLAFSPARIDTTTPAGVWLSTLFGHNLSGVTNSLARYAGIRESSASTLLLTCAPLVLGYLGRLIRSDNLSAAGLAERLRVEQPQIASAVPAGFEIPGITRAPYETTHAVVDQARRQREARRENWSFPLAALLATLGIGGLIWWGLDSARHTELPQVKVENAVPNAVGTTGVVSPPSSPPTLASHPDFTFPPGSVEDRLSRYLSSSASGSMKVDLDRLEFESGSSRLTQKSRAQLGDLAAILRGYPAANIAIAGYTDNVGGEAANLALSRARAEAVAGALTSGGVAANHLRAEGYGSQRPVADNSTARGRAQNRRVTLEVTR